MKKRKVVNPLGRIAKHMKKVKLFLIAGVVFAGITAASAQGNVMAAEKTGNGIYQLETSFYEKPKTTDSYDKADVTGDKKKDTIETELSGEILSLKVNGKAVKKWDKTKVWPYIYVITLSNKKSYLGITSEANGGTLPATTAGLFEIKNGKLKSVLDFSKAINKKQLAEEKFVSMGYGFDMVYFKKVSNNTLYIDFSIGTKSLGQLKQIRNLKVAYKKGKMILQDGAGSVQYSIIPDTENTPFTSFFVAAQQLQIVKKPGTSQKAFTIDKDTSFSVQKAGIYNKDIYVQVKTENGKTGWLKLSTSKKQLVKTASTVVWG